MNPHFLHKLRLSTHTSLALAVFGGGFALALWQTLPGVFESQEALRYAGAATSFFVARAMAACPVCRHPAV